MNYAKLTIGLIIGWFVFALSASALYLFHDTSNRIGGWHSRTGADCSVLTLVRNLRKLSTIRNVFEPEDFDLRASLETDRIHVRSPGGSRRAPSSIRAARWIWRYDHRRDRRVRSMEARRARSPHQLHPVAIAWNPGPGYRREHRHNRCLAQPTRSFDSSHDRAALELDSNLPCAVICDASYNLHRAGKGVENRTAACQANAKARAISRSLAA
jgi:hypothetical protein